MLKYAVYAWDAPTVVYRCYRDAKTAWRRAKKECYTAYIKPWRGRVPRLGGQKRRPFQLEVY